MCVPKKNDSMCQVNIKFKWNATMFRKEQNRFILNRILWKIEMIYSYWIHFVDRIIHMMVFCKHLWWVCQKCINPLNAHSSIYQHQWTMHARMHTFQTHTHISSYIKGIWLNYVNVQFARAHQSISLCSLYAPGLVNAQIQLNRKRFKTRRIETFQEPMQKENSELVVYLTACDMSHVVPIVVKCCLEFENSAVTTVIPHSTTRRASSNVDIH